MVVHLACTFNTNTGDSDRAVYIATSCAKSTVLGLSSLVNGGAFPNLSYDDSI